MIWIFLLICVVFIVLYVVQFEIWHKAWNNSPEFELASCKNKPFLTVVVAYRNEVTNLPVLLNSLAKQRYEYWELILVDDHSDDYGLGCCTNQINSFPVEIKTLINDGEGKKQALLTGARAAKGELVVTTDADCFFHQDWLATIAAFYNTHTPDLIIAPVKQLEDANLLSRFQISEFLALQISGGAAALNSRPIMLNGANLACKRMVYLNANLNESIVSGDDMFLLEWAKQHHCKIDYLKSSCAMVFTSTEPTLDCLLKQKSRWARKAKYYTDKNILISGGIVAAANSVLLVLMILAFAQPQFAFVFLMLFIVRFATDMRLLYSGVNFFSYVPRIWLLLMFQLVYPFYVLMVVLYPLFFSLQWKGRKIRA